MPGKVTPVVGYQMPGTAITFPVVRAGTATPEISQGGGGTTSGDFVYRRTSPGVVRWHKFDAGSTIADFDTAPQAGYDSLGPNYMSYAQGYTYGWQQPTSAANLAQKPVIDTSIMSSGSGSMRIDIVQGSDAAQGFFITHLSASPSFGIGAGQKFFIQWRQRINQAYYDTIVLDGSGSHQAGIKDLLLTASAQYGAHGNNSMQVVALTYYQTKMLSAMCDDLNANSVRLMDTSGGTQDWIQDQLPGCTRNAILNTPYPEPAPPPSCFGMLPNVWQTYQVEIDLTNSTQVFVGNNRYAWQNSEFRLWGQNEGASTATLLINWRPGVSGYFPLDAGELLGLQYQTAWFDPQITGKSTSQNHPTMSLWFDEIIVSTQKIPDVGSFPAWRNGYAVGTRGQIANTAQMSGYVFKTPRGSSLNDTVEGGWSGYTHDGASTWYSAANGGHSTDDHSAWQNMVLQIDFSQAAPTWTELDPGSDFGNLTTLARNLDGRPCTRHMYYCSQYASAAHTADAKARIMLIGAFAAWAEAADSSWASWSGSKYGAGPEVTGFRIGDRAWDDAATWTSMPQGTATSPWACVTDHRTGFIYFSHGSFLYYLNPATNSWTMLIDQASRMIDNWNYGTALIDTNAERNKIVAVMPGSASWTSDDTLRLERVGLGGYSGAGAVDTIPLTTTVPGGFAAFSTPLTDAYEASVVHNLDIDRYWLFRKCGVATPIVEINPTTGDTRELSLMVPSNGDQGALGRVAYLQAQGCVVYYARWADNIYFYPTR